MVITGKPLPVVRLYMCISHNVVCNVMASYVVACYICIYVTESAKQVISAQNTPIHFIISISFCVGYTVSVSFIEFLRKFCVYDEILMKHYVRKKSY